MSSAGALHRCRSWFSDQGWKPFPFQLQAWSTYLDGGCGLVNAPTGSGKTYSLLLPAIAEGVERMKTDPKSCDGVQLIWITPIRALAKEIHQSAERAVQALGAEWEVGVRTGDSTQKVKQAQKKKLPQILITTPESIHVMLSNKGYAKLFKNLRAVVIDEWHELMGSKRAVQCELFLSKFRALQPELRTWGISATIGNMEESMEILMGAEPSAEPQIIKANIEKSLVIEPVLPEEVETLPWAGHLGIRLLRSGGAAHPRESEHVDIYEYSCAGRDLVPADIGCRPLIGGYIGDAPQCHFERGARLGGRGPVRRPTQGSRLYLFFGPRGRF